MKFVEIHKVMAYGSKRYDAVRIHGIAVAK